MMSILTFTLDTFLTDPLYWWLLFLQTGMWWRRPQEQPHEVYLQHLGKSKSISHYAYIYFYLFRGNVEADLQKSFNNCSENVSETFLHKSKFNFIKKKIECFSKAVIWVTCG